jgi:HK97 family phage prohead protease
MYLEKKISATMRERKQLSCALEIKTLDTQGFFSGYASVFNVVDNQKDIMLRGAFSQSIHKGMSKVKFLWQHQQDEPIGSVQLLKEDDYGLFVQGVLLLDVARGQEAYSLLKAGAINGLSIGYSPVRYQIDPETGVRMLAEVDLWEISLVTFPANNEAVIRAIKSDAADVQYSPMQAIAFCEAIDRAQQALHRLMR